MVDIDEVDISYANYLTLCRRAGQPEEEDMNLVMWEDTPDDLKAMDIQILIGRVANYRAARMRAAIGSGDRPDSKEVAW